MTTPTRSTIAAVLAAASVALGSAQQRSQAEIDLQAAIRTESVNGDLAAAIRQYTAIVNAHQSERAVVATALLHMADCYQKMGDAESRRIYERLVREFADQTEAVATARARLGGPAQPAARSTRGDRALWTGPEVDLFGTVSPDGRYLSYTDWATTNNTMIHDFVTGKDRALTANRSRYGEFGESGWSAISRDGRQIAFQWKPAGTDDNELRLSPLAGTGVPKSRLLKRFTDGEAPRPFDWSPEGSWLAVLLERVDGGSTIGLVSTVDGTVRQLKSIDWRGVNKMVFSADGRWVAYDVATTDDGGQSEVRVMAIDGSREHIVVATGTDNRVMAWSPDGNLVFASRNSGTLSLWTIPVRDGMVSGAARLAKENIISPWSLGMTTAGSLYIWKRASTPYVKVAPIDFSSGRLLDDDSLSSQTYIGSRGRATWSSDGKSLAYISCGSQGGGPCALYVRDMTSGVVSQARHSLRYLGFPQFSPDGRRVVADGRDSKGRSGLFIIDVASGVTTKLGSVDVPGLGWPEWARDGQSIRYQTRQAGQRVVIERRSDSATTREILRIPAAVTDRVRFSPDDRWYAYMQSDTAQRQSKAMVAPFDGGEPRAVLTAPINGIGFHFVWLPDSSGLLVQRRDATSHPESLWLAPVAGAPRKLDIDVTRWHDGGTFAVHPDGRHLAFTAFAGNAGGEIWALENFLPVPVAPQSR
jgi:Tol biopolymer transport system component